jgi:DegV family protein with EDD domain
MARVAIITDSSADIVPEQALAAGIKVVPHTVSFGDDSFEIGTELSNESFYERLSAGGEVSPRTTAPASGAFEEAYREALGAGATGVLCITLSAGISATFSHAVKAAEPFDGGSVVVMDAMTTTLSQALLVRAAADMAASARTLPEVVAHIRDLRLRSRLYFVLDSVEHLRRSGFIGRRKALAFSLLSVKPILTVDSGVVSVADRKRTAAKARARLLGLCIQRPIERAMVAHTMAPDVEGFTDEFASRSGLDRSSVEVALTGPILVSWLGLGSYGVCLITTA